MRKPGWPILAALFAAGALAQQGADPFERVATVDHAPIAEISGIAKSATYDDVWWVHNDSGDSARLFAIDGKGKPIVPAWLKDAYLVGPEKGPKQTWPGIEVLQASNVDWEDLTLGGGKIYVSEMGNNGNARRDLGVYVINEPNPRAVNMTRILKFLPIRYPDQERFPAKLWHFDCEALFVDSGKLYFLTKHRQPGQISAFERGTKLYRLDTGHTDKENVLTLVEKRADLALPTAADLSPDGKRLAVATVLAIWVFERPGKGDRWLSGEARRIDLPRERTLQAEAITWDDDATLRLANEQRGVFRLELSALQAVAESD